MSGQVAAGAAELYVRELARIGSLSSAGSAQLAADLDYFCNVLAALGVALPPQLVTWQVPCFLTCMPCYLRIYMFVFCCWAQVSVYKE